MCFGFNPTSLEGWYFLTPSKLQLSPSTLQPVLATLGEPLWRWQDRAGDRSHHPGVNIGQSEARGASNNQSEVSNIYETKPVTHDGFSITNRLLRRSSRGNCIGQAIRYLCAVNGMQHSSWYGPNLVKVHDLLSKLWTCLPIMILCFGSLALTPEDEWNIDWREHLPVMSDIVTGTLSWSRVTGDKNAPVISQVLMSRI